VNPFRYLAQILCVDIRVAIFTQDINNIEYVTHGKERYMFNVCIYDLRAGVNLEMGLFNVQGCHACVFFRRRFFGVGIGSTSKRLLAMGRDTVRVAVWQGWPYKVCANY